VLHGTGDTTSDDAISSVNLFLPSKACRARETTDIRDRTENVYKIYRPQQQRCDRDKLQITTTEDIRENDIIIINVRISARNATWPQ